jgi:hypothetical protein
MVMAVEQLHAWLTDPSTGLNTQLAAVPGESSTLATCPTFAHAFSTATPWAASEVIERDHVPTSGAPILVITPLGVQDSGTRAGQAHSGAGVGVACRVALRASNRATAARRGWQYLRAAHRVVAMQYASNNGRAVVRNAVAFDPPSLRYEPDFQQTGDDLWVGALVVTFPAHDRWALGGTA